MAARRTLLALLVVALWALPSSAQDPNQKTKIQFQNAGSNVFFGTGYFVVNFVSGCTAANSGGVLNITCTGGSGGVSSFSSGNLSPLFTTSVATSTTTPAQSFALSNAAAGGFLSNLTATAAGPAYNALTSINPQTATYQALASDFSGYKTITVASGTFNITLVASGTQPPAGQWINIINYGSGTVTIVRSGQNINGATTSVTLANGASVVVPSSSTCVSDGTNYFCTQSGQNAAQLTGKTWAAPAAIGSTTPAAGSFTALTGTTLDTTTHCAAVGSGANPSLVACSAAAAGLFSCATNASAGTCVVSTTAVTASSAIQVQPDSSLGTALSVTCNTTADSGLTAPRVSARSAGTSFTITMGTFTSNPECFSYLVIN